MYIRVSFSFKISLCVELRKTEDLTSYHCLVKLFASCASLTSFLNINSIRYDTVNPPNTLIADIAIAVQPRTFVADPLS